MCDARGDGLADRHADSSADSDISTDEHEHRFAYYTTNGGVIPILYVYTGSHEHRDFNEYGNRYLHTHPESERIHSSDAPRTDKR